MVWICVCAALALLAVIVYRRVMWPRPLTCGQGKVKIACVGDSITYSLGVLGRRRKWSYPAMLAQKLGGDYFTVNYGLSDRALLSSSDKPYFREKLGQKAWNDPADIVIFMLGSNDVKRKNWNAAAFEKEYEATICHYLEKTERLIVMIPPRIFYADPGKNGYDDAILKNELSPIVRALAEKYRLPCVDLYALTANHREWFPDRLHPNRTGNAAIAEAVASHIIIYK